MNANFIMEVLSGLNGDFNDKQLKKIEKMLIKCLKNKEIREIQIVQPQTNEEALSFFIAAKKIEGCSQKSLNYYYTTVSKMLDTIGVLYYLITTEDIRTYLSDYRAFKRQQANGIRYSNGDEKAR